MTPQVAMPHGFDPVSTSPAHTVLSVAPGQSVAWRAWKWFVQLLAAAAALGVAFEGERHAVDAAAGACVALALVAHFAWIDARRFRRDGGGDPVARPGLLPQAAGGHAAGHGHAGASAGPVVGDPQWSQHGVVAHRVRMPPGAMAGHHLVAPEHRVSVVPPSGMPVAGRWSFVAPSDGGQAPDSRGTGSSSRSSTRSGRLR